MSRYISVAARARLLGALAVALGATGCGDSGGVTGGGPASATDSASDGEADSDGATESTSAGPTSDTTTSVSNGPSPTLTDADPTSASDPSDSSGPVEPLMIDCGAPPAGAVGASYQHTIGALGGQSPYGWDIVGLPAGLTFQSFSGMISGTPEEAGEFALQVTLTDWNDDVVMKTCPLTINEQLSVDLDGVPKPCIWKDDSILSYLSGGSGEPITCSVPGGKGGGKLPEGVNIDADDCTIQGAITELNYGTWAWIVEAKQGDVSVYAPYCATQPLQLPQSYPITATHAGGDQLVPATGTFAPGEPIKFDGDAEPLFEIPGCGGPPCYHETVVQFTPSPFGAGACEDDADGCFGICPLEPDGNEPDGDKQQPCKLLDGFLGLQHELWAKGDAVGPTFEGRPWIAHHTLHYCMGSTQDYCAGGLEVVKENGHNSNLEFSVIMWPE